MEAPQSSSDLHGSVSPSSSQSSSSAHTTERASETADIAQSSLAPAKRTTSIAPSLFFNNPHRSDTTRRSSLSPLPSPIVRPRSPGGSIYYTSADSETKSPLLQGRGSESSLSPDDEKAGILPPTVEGGERNGDGGGESGHRGNGDDDEEGAWHGWTGGNGGTRHRKGTGGALFSLGKIRLWIADLRLNNTIFKRVAIPLTLVVVVILIFVARFAASDIGLQDGSKALARAKNRLNRPTNVFKWDGKPQWFTPPVEKLKSASPLVRLGPSREIDIASEPLPMEATLKERLAIWEASPGGRGPGVHLGLDGEYHEEIELGGFNTWNLESCSGIDHQSNTHMIQKSANVWGTMNRTTTWQTRMSLISHMRDIQAQGLTNNHGEGRGIVMVAGNADTLTRVKWSVAYMRSQGTTLPIQVYHFPSETRPADDPLVLELNELGVELVEAKGQAKDAGKSKSYHLKAIAVVQCPWREVLYLDSDSIPARDPEYMFDAPSYKRLGIWATPDYWKTSGNNAIWAIIGVRCRDEWEMETGQMFIDKAHHLDVFLLIKYMLENHQYFFYFSDGDKDIFRWALLALRKRWGVPGRWVGAGALPSGTASGEFCAHTMLQHDAWGQPLFVHYNLLKQIPSGVGRGFSWGRTKQMPLFNAFPATPATARAGELAHSDHDLHLRGLGDVDCDMLADADEFGNTRAPAREEIKRRAARERGIKVRYHGGAISALCIDIEWSDPRPEWMKVVSERENGAKNRLKEQAQRQWDEAKAAAEEAGLPEPPKPDFLLEVEPTGPVQPDWGQSPLEVAYWGDDENLRDFESKIYDLGFIPSGPGF